MLVVGGYGGDEECWGGGGESLFVCIGYIYITEVYTSSSSIYFTSRFQCLSFFLQYSIDEVPGLELLHLSRFQYYKIVKLISLLKEGLIDGVDF